MLVGHDPVHADAMLCEETMGSLRELGRRGCRLVGKDAGKSHAAGVVHADVHVVIATVPMAPCRVFPGFGDRRAAESLPASEVDVHQLAVERIAVVARSHGRSHAAERNHDGAAWHRWSSTGGPAASRCGPRRSPRRSLRIRAICSAGRGRAVRFGRELRPADPAGVRFGTDLYPVAQETPAASATCAAGQPTSSTSRTKSRRPGCARVALVRTISVSSSVRLW